MHHMRMRATAAAAPPSGAADSEQQPEQQQDASWDDWDEGAMQMEPVGDGLGQQQQQVAAADAPKNRGGRPKVIAPESAITCIRQELHDAIHSEVDRHRLGDKRDGVLKLALTLASECCEIKKSGIKDIIVVPAAIAADAPAGAASAPVVGHRFVKAETAAAAIYDLVRRLHTSAPQLTKEDASVADIVDALRDVLPRGRGSTPSAAAGSSSKRGRGSTPSAAAGSSKRGRGNTPSSAPGEGDRGEGIVPRGRAVLQNIKVDRNGEQFKFVYGTSTDPSAATAGGWKDILEQKCAETSRLNVFRCSLDGSSAQRAFVVAPSAQLDKLGEPLQWGVYPWGERTEGAAQAFLARNSFIGVYLGFIMGLASCPRTSPIVDGLPEEQFNSIITISTAHGKVLLDGKNSPFMYGDLLTNIPGTTDLLFPADELNWPGMCAHLMNCITKTGRRPNVVVTSPHGVVMTTQDIPLWDDDKDFRDNIESELL